MKKLYMLALSASLNGFDLNKYSTERAAHYQLEARKKEFAQRAIGAIGTALTCAGCVICMPCCACSTSLASFGLFLRLQEEARRAQAKKDFFDLCRINSHKHVLKKYGLHRLTCLNRETLDALASLEAYPLKKHVIKHKKIESSINRESESLNSCVSMVLILAGFVVMPYLDWPSALYLMPPLASFSHNGIGRLGDMTEAKNAWQLLADLKKDKNE